MKEERKAHVLIEQGYDSAIDGEAYASVFFQNANHSVRVTDDFMRAVEEDRDWWTRNVNDGKPCEEIPRARPAARDGRFRLALRRSRHAVRHHRQSLAHLQGHGPHQRVESVLRVHVPGRHGLQPGFAQPDEVPRAQRPVRRRSFQPRRGRHHHRAGNSGGQRQLPHGENRAQFARLPSAGHRLRQPGRAADVARAALRFRRRPRFLRRHHRADVRRSLRPVRAHRRAHGALRRLPAQSRSHARRHSHAPRFAAPDQGRARAAFTSARRPQSLGTTRSSSAKSSATRIRRSPCSLPPAPSAS